MEELRKGRWKMEDMDRREESRKFAPPEDVEVDEAEVEEDDEEVQRKRVEEDEDKTRSSLSTTMMPWKLLLSMMK